ncbi:dihydrolipoyl dehydrogenase [Pelosinus sp. sgz500959]|uniref:dihydrolipoyl dehydrogenase n=1 Tax=Pelosinus sp. sgz500959 TaxID=3242472 RepID=UPI00366EB2D4
MVYDIAVIGGGPGGYVAAIRAAQLGGKVLLVEKDMLGGVCLNRGCIPTKTLLKSAEKWRELQNCHEFGLEADHIGFNFDAITQRKQQVVSKLRGGIEQLIKSNEIEMVYGEAVLKGQNQLSIRQGDIDTHYEAKNIIIATGSAPMTLPIPGHDLPDVIDSNQLLEINHVPASMMVIGAGAVGIEFAAIFRDFGSEVTVVEMLPTILPNIDNDVIKRMAPILRKQGIKILTNTKVIRIEQHTEGVKVSLDNGKAIQEIIIEKVLIATGRKPVVLGLGLETAGIDYSQLGIIVNNKMETNIPGIYAIGDVTGQEMWAHAASAEGIVAAENALGRQVSMDYSAVPGCIFTTPELAMVGLTEQGAQEQNINIKVSKFNFASNGKAVSMGETDGLVKIIAHAESDKVLGMHILGAHASDLIMEGAIAIRNGLTAKEIGHTIHLHPSLSETVMESAHGIHGDIIHQLILKGRK